MPEQIDFSKIIKKSIEDFSVNPSVEEVGTVVESTDGIVRVQGLPLAMAGEMIEFQNNIYGLVFNLEREDILVVLLGPHTAVREGDLARRTKKVMQVPVGEALIGRVVNAIGLPLDGFGPVKTDKFRPVERIAPGVIDRTPVIQPLQTGYKLVDALIPIGRGQRELIIGDRATGKSTMGIDAILNQKGQNVICIYVAIGQKEANVVSVVETLRECGAMEYTIVVAAPASDPASFQYLAPFTGCAMGEEFMYSGRDALIIYDDLTKHAQAYRMISLLLRRPPGREAYPGDVFYLHSRLLERAAKLKPELGGGSMTAIPIIETQLGDVTSYIPTNVISITDGQIYLEADLFNANTRPAVNVGLSVSRVGSSAQTKAMRKIAGRLKMDISQYQALEAFASFGGADLDKATRDQLNRGKRIIEILKQPVFSPMSIEKQIAIIYAVINGYLDDIQVEKVREFETGFLKFMESSFSAWMKTMAATKELTIESEDMLKKAIQQYKQGLTF